MINVPINIKWRDYMFQYPVSVSSNTEKSRVFQYGVTEQEKEIDPHPYHNIEYVQFINKNYTNLKQIGNYFYKIPCPKEPLVGDEYNFTIYNEDCNDIVHSGTSRIVVITGNYIKFEIENPSNDLEYFIIHGSSISDSVINLYDGEGGDTGKYIILYPNIIGFNKDLMPDDPNRQISTGESYNPAARIQSRKVIFNLPWFRIDNYINTNYVIKFTMWISGVEVLLGSYLITPNLYKAAPYKVYKEGRYSESVEFYIVDPWSLLYDDEWKSWRTEVCGEISDINNTGTPLDINIIPVTDIGGYYDITPGSGIGAANILVSDKSDYLQLNIRFEDSTSDIVMNIDYNKSYDNILEYLKETYLINITEEDAKIGYDLMITDNKEEIGVIEYEQNNKYLKDIESWGAYLDTLIGEERTKMEESGFLGSRWMESVSFDKSELGIPDWSEYKDGLFLYGYAEILDGDDVVFSITSLPIPLTPDIYKYLIITDLDSQPINLNKIGKMLNYVIYAVNKINKNVIQVDNAKEYKSHIIHPEFFQANKINNIYIHPEVTENICLPLNAYKSKVDFFYIKIEGVIFSEIGRNHSGVIFKIQGNLLPHKISEGTAYILNKDKELVTTGSFKYIS